MKSFFTAIFFAFLLVPGFTIGQTVVYKNYDVRDGLAGSTVYRICQDKKGFMWFCTNHGLSRFDGTNFKNYTTRDGLPDNEVFGMAEDSMGRLWMICYNSNPCFMYNGIIHNQYNDTLLKNIESQESIFYGIRCDKEGRVWILGHKTYVVDKTRLYKFMAPEYRPGQGDDNTPMGVGYFNNRPCLETDKGIFEISWRNDSISFRRVATFDVEPGSSPCFFNGSCYIRSMTLLRVSPDSVLSVNLPALGIKGLISGHTIFNPHDSTLLISAGKDGIKAFTTDLKLLPDPYPFLPQSLAYSYTVFDRDGNTWISSLGGGVFFIPVNRTIQYKPPGSFQNPNSTSIYRAKNGTIYVGFDGSNYGMLKSGSLSIYKVHTSYEITRLIRQCRMNENALLWGEDQGLFYVPVDNAASATQVNGYVIKNLAAEGNDSALVAGINSAYRVIKKGSKFITENLWNTRTTAICKDHEGKIWLGSLKGLFINEGGTVTPFHKNALIANARITDLLCDEHGRIWAATGQRGVFVITGDSIIAINSSNGLPDNNCVRFFKEKNGIIWICTDQNISTITYSGTGKFPFQISTSTELWAGEIVSVNDIAVDSAFIYVATTDGVFQIEKSGGKRPGAQVYVTSFKASDSVYSDFNSVKLKYFQNNIQIDYTGISYNSTGKVAYKYILNSGDTVFTSNSSLNLSSLAPGDYLFGVWAKSSSGEWSPSPALAAFSIAPPFWRTWWFTGLLLIAVILGVAAVVQWRIWVIRLRENEKTRINKKMAEIELEAVRSQLEAVRSQMNEHFVFNALNSIQNYINQNNTEAASFYLANFGALIRRTLDLSSCPTISLQDEIDYLENYLTLEKMRFKEKLDYHISNDIAGIAADTIVFPSMVLQPYVENAVKHGLWYKTDGRGRLEISFAEENKFIVCRIEDNGIGRKMAEELKSNRQAQHQSKGIILSHDKVYLYNRVHDNKIRVEIEDKMTNEVATGTLVKIYVPLEINL